MKSTYSMLIVGLLLQIISFFITKDAWLSFVSGISGVFAVVYCSERKISYYVWAFIQLITFTIICWKSELYGKLIENTFNFITLIIGVFIWLRHLDNNKKIITKKLTSKQWFLCIYIGFLVFLILYSILVKIDGTLPILDASSTTLAIIAQILMITRYKESWILWIIIDLMCIVIWLIKGDFCMVSQYVFWIVNAIYGYNIWNKNIK